MVLSILIVNWNTCVYLKQCLASIRQHPCSEAFEVIVVDNASTDASAAMVAREFPEVHLLQSSKNLGYAGGNNLAFAAARGEFLLTLNPDTEVFPGTLDRAIESLRQAGGYGALGARQIGLNDETQSSIRGFPTWLGILGQLTGLSKILPYSRFGSYQLPRFNYDQAQDAPQPMGTFLLFKRTALAQVGDQSHPMDEHFPIFFNEVDLLYRLYQSDWPCWYDPDVRIRHVGGAGTKQVRKSMIWESHRSLLRYFRKHRPDGWIGWALYPLLALIVWVAAFVRARGFHVGFRP